MKKHYFKLLGIMLCALLCSNAFAEKLAYGFHVNDYNYGEEKYLCTLDVENFATQKTINKIQDYTAGTPVCGTYAEKYYYLLAQPKVGTTGLYKVDLKTNSYETIIEQVKDGEDTKIQATSIAYNPITKTMYVSTSSFNGSVLYTINLDNGIVSKVKELTTPYYALACSADGVLYGLSSKGVLFSIDQVEGTETQIISLFDKLTMLKAKTCSLFFDYETNKLYCYCTDGDDVCYYINIDLENNTKTSVTFDGEKGDTGDQLTGLSFIQKVDIKPIDPPGVRTAYGLNYTATDAQIVSFDANAVDKGVTKASDFTFASTPQAGVYAKNAYYMVDQDPTDKKYYLYKTTDVTSGTFEKAGDETIGVLVKDMAYDPYSDIIYVVGDSTRMSTYSMLYSVDKTTGKLKVAQHCSTKYIALTALNNGQLYGITTEGDLNKVYATSGQANKVATLDNETFSTNFPCDLEFDLSTLTLYWSFQNEGSTSSKSVLATIDPATGKITSEKAFKDGTAVIGLYFPEKEVEPTATWYGFCYANDNTLDKERGKMESFVSFDPANLASVTLLPTNISGVGCGTYGEGGYYTFSVQSNGYGVDPTSFSVIDIKTWQQTKLFDIEDIPVMWDITYDYSSSMFYSVSLEGDPDPNMTGSLINTYSSLYSLSIINGQPQWKKIARLDKEYRSIACSLRGELYGMNIDGELCKLNKITGTPEVYMANTGIFVETSLTSSLEFDHNDEMLYMTYFSRSILQGDKRTASHAYLAKIDLNEKQVTQKIFPGIDKICALYIPFERDPNIPGKVTDFKVTPGKYGELTATLKWKNPMKTLGGETLAAITSIEIIRNGVTIHTETEAAKLVPGASVTFEDGEAEDQKPTNGFNNYVVNVINEAGTGEVSSQLVFIGQDTPAAPQEVTLTVENGTKAVLTWKAPTIGANTGWLNPNGLSYDVVRQPDNVKVAEMTTLYKFTEDIDILNYYYYEVIANNAQGTSEAGKSNSEVIGTAMAVPYECDFTSEADLGLWTTEGTWSIDYLGMGEGVRGLHHGYPGEKADDWAYSPAISLSKDKIYKLQFDARCVTGTGKESMNVFAGTDRTPEAQTILIKDLPSVGGTPTELETYEVNFKVPADGHYYLGFHCYSFEDPDTEKWIFELQTSNINLTETNGDGIDSNSMNDIRIYAANGKIHVEGEYTSATVYDQMGIARSIDTTLTSGVYFVKVMNGNATETYKVLVK